MLGFASRFGVSVDRQWSGNRSNEWSVLYAPTMSLFLNRNQAAVIRYRRNRLRSRLRGRLERPAFPWSTSRTASPAHRITSTTLPVSDDGRAPRPPFGRRGLLPWLGIKTLKFL